MRLRLAALTLFAIAAPPAHAATPGVLGTSTLGPTVAVDASGKGHVAWAEDSTTTTAVVRYCRVAPGATACERTDTLQFPPNGAGADGPNSQASTEAFVSVTGGAVTVIAACYGCGTGNGDRIGKWQSTDGGTSFGPFVQLQTPNEFSPGSTPLLLGSGVSGIFTYLSGNTLHAVAEPGVTGGGYALTTQADPADQGLATVPGTNKVIAVRDSLYANPVRFNVFTDPTGGSALTPDPGEFESAANWTTPLDPGGAGTVTGTSVAVAGGAAGAAMIYVDAATHLVARKFDPATGQFGAPVQLSGDKGFGTDVAASPTGRLHAVWDDSSSTLGRRLLYATSDDGGATWTRRGKLVGGETSLQRVAAGPAGGFAVWASSVIGGSVSIVPLDPVADTAPAVPAPIPVPVPGPTPSGPTAATGPAGPATRPAATTVTTKASGSGAEFGLSAPRACVPRGGTFVTTLAVKKQKKKGNLFVKVTKVDFLVSGKRVKTDRKAPFKQTLKVAVAATSGTKLKVTARAFIKVTKGRKIPKKSISVTVKVC